MRTYASSRVKRKSFYRKSELQGPVARSMVSVNQRLIPWQRIGLVKANHALSNSAQMFLLISGSHIGAPKRYTNMASPVPGDIHSSTYREKNDLVVVLACYITQA